MKNSSLDSDCAQDEQLMTQLTRKPDIVLQRLYQRYGEVLYGVVMRVLHDSTDTEEVLQDVFVQLWQRPDKFESEKGTVLAWLVTLARRRAIDRVRQRMAYRRATDRLESQSRHHRPLESDCHTVELTAERDDLHEYLEGIINHLPPAQKDVIQATFFSGMSQRQIAHARHLPLGTVKTRIELGLRRMASMMLKAKVA